MEYRARIDRSVVRRKGQSYGLRIQPIGQDHGGRSRKLAPGPNNAGLRLTQLDLAHLRRASTEGLRPVRPEEAAFIQRYVRNAERWLALLLSPPQIRQLRPVLASWAMASWARIRHGQSCLNPDPASR